MIMRDIHPDELIRFFEALDSVAKFRFAAPYNDLNRDDRIEVLMIFERGYQAGFMSWPDEHVSGLVENDNLTFTFGDPDEGC